MSKDLKYITENFIELETLCQMAKISKDTLQQLIDKAQVPNYSYKIESTSVISSPLGDSVEVVTVQKFFAKSSLNAIKENLKQDNADNFKQKTKHEFLETFKAHKDKAFAYGNLITTNGNIDTEQLDIAFETEWQHYLNGIYGICTLNATGTEIAKKEIAVKKLIAFIEANKGEPLNDRKKQELVQLSAQYNEVSNLFAPYQRATSSRGKYLDKTLVENALSELVKPYNNREEK